MSKHRRIQFGALVWREADGPARLARALGKIAADLWLSGRLRLTSDHSVATLLVDATAPSSGEDRDDQAEGDGGGCKAVA